MPRWFALCHGTVDFPGCPLCRRFVVNNAIAAKERQQAMTAPDLRGRHCNKFMGLPPAVGIPPTHDEAKTHG